MKDNFSIQSENYKKYRPTYPKELYEFLLNIVPDKQNAWDCGTGNGQVAQYLAGFFENVFATDISKNQIENAVPNRKIQYSVQKAENTIFPDNTFDLITVAQAIHWFEFEEFYKEVYRTIKPYGIIAIIGYGLIKSFKEADDLILSFYKSLKLFWDPERRYIDECYQTIPFPFKEVKTPEMFIECEWTLEHLVHYLGTWSGVHHYQKNKNQNPVDLIHQKLKEIWGRAETRKVVFPIFFRIGRIDKTDQS